MGMPKVLFQIWWVDSKGIEHKGTTTACTDNDASSRLIARFNAGERDPREAHWLLKPVTYVPNTHWETKEESWDFAEQMRGEHF
jgi:hypothetical protein